MYCFFFFISCAYRILVHMYSHPGKFMYMHETSWWCHFGEINVQRAGHSGPSLKCTGGRVMGMQFKQWLISVFSLACPAMHNRQSAPSHMAVATNGQLLIIVLLNTRFSQPGTDCSAGAIIIVRNKATLCYVSERTRDRGKESRDNEDFGEARTRFIIFFPARQN